MRRKKRSSLFGRWGIAIAFLYQKHGGGPGIDPFTDEPYPAGSLIPTEATTERIWAVRPANYQFFQVKLAMVVGETHVCDGTILHSNDGLARWRCKKRTRCLIVREGPTAPMIYVPIEGFILLDEIGGSGANE